MAHFHPRLFATLVLIDPVVALVSSTDPSRGPNPAQMSTYRRDIWPSREEAKKSFLKSPFYQKWDSRALDRWIKYGLRDLPTPVHPEGPSPDGKTPVTLTTTKHQEVFTFLRPNFEGYGANKAINRKTHADLNPALITTYPFYRAEPPRVYLRLEELRPSALYIFGGKSDVSLPEASKAKVEKTGTGVGGSGGAQAGRVKGVTFEDIGHLIPMEVSERTATTTADWLKSELDVWYKDEEEFRKLWDNKPMREKRIVDDKWIEMTGPLPGRKPRASTSRL